MCVPTGTRDWERPERAPCSAGWAPRRQKSSRCSARSRSRGGLERRPIDPRLWARNLDVGNEAPATGFGRGARGGGAGVGVGCAGPRRTTGRANGAREQKNILAAAPAFGGSLDMTMGRVCAGWQGRGRAGSARGFALVCSPVGLFVRSPCGSSLRFCGFVNRTRRSRFFGAVCVCSVLRVAVSSVGSDAASS